MLQVESGTALLARRGLQANPLEDFVIVELKKRRRGCVERRNEMVLDTFTREKLALEHRQRLLCEAEHEQLPADVQKLLPHPW